MSNHGGVLSFDPGAKRCGWAHLDLLWTDQTPALYWSGISGLERERNGKKVPYQEFRLDLIDYWKDEAYNKISQCKPDVVATETVPVVGGGNFVLAADSQLVATVVTTIQTIAKLEGVEVVQVAANTVKKHIGLGGTSKARVRNGVLSVFPELEPRRKEFVKVFDETDAIAVGLTHLGVKV